MIEHICRAWKTIEKWKNMSCVNNHQEVYMKLTLYTFLIHIPGLVVQDSFIFITWKGIFNEEKLGWFDPGHFNWMIHISLQKILSDISWKMILFQRRFAEKYFYFYIIMCTDESHTQFEQECVWRK